MRILMLTYEITDRGGNFIRSFSLAKSLVKIGHEVTLLSSGNRASLCTNKQKRGGVTIIEVADIFPSSFRHNGMSLMQVINRCSLVGKNKFDIVHGFGHRPSVLIPALFYKIIYKKPYIADWADLWGKEGIASRRGRITKPVIGFFDGSLEKIVYSKLANGVTVICQDLRKRLLCYKTSNKIKLISVGASIDEINPVPKSKAREIEKIEKNIPIVVFVGNADYDEAFLARSFIELNILCPRVKMIFIGKRMFVFENILKNEDIHNKLIYKGFIKHENLSNILACGDVLLLPYSDKSINRGRFPNKLGDYMAAGRPIVTNPTGDLVSLFQKYKIGILADENPKKFAQAVNILLQNQVLRNSMGKTARQVAYKKMSWDLLARRLEKFYKYIYQSNRIR